MCSIQGGLFISFVVVLCNIFKYGIFNFLKLDKNIIIIGLKIFLIGGIIGFIGSFINSLFGQTVQLSIL